MSSIVKWFSPIAPRAFLYDSWSMSVTVETLRDQNKFLKSQSTKQDS